jgi:hypothetical protein
MSADLFTNGTEAIQRLESLLEAKMKKYTVSTLKSKLADGKIFHSITIEGFVRDGSKHIYKTIDGESFPDVFNKASDFITTA